MLMIKATRDAILRPLQTASSRSRMVMALQTQQRQRVRHGSACAAWRRRTPQTSTAFAGGRGSLTCWRLLATTA